MKGLNKLALATAVAAAPFATQAMEPMSESEMGNTTGQAGVTIELETQLSMDQIQYSQSTDTADTGSVLVNNLEVGGIGTAPDNGFSDALDMEIKVDLPSGSEQLSDFGSKAGQTNSNGGAVGGQDLDLNDGDALISVQNYNSPDADGDAVPVDMRLEMGTSSETNPDGEGAAFQLSSFDGENTATLISELKADVFLTQLDIIARNDAVTDGAGNTAGSDANGAIEIEAAFGLDDLDAQFDVASVGIEDMRMAGVGSLAAMKGGALAQGSGAIVGSPAGAAIVSMDIGQGASISGNGPDETLRVNLSNFQADIWMPTITVGANGDGTTTGRSIGSVGISNLQVSNTQMSIYGRD